MDIKNKVALVTGGAHRVGKAITLMLARAGANVVINYHTSAAQAEATAEEVRALGAKPLIIQANIADYNQVKAMVGQVKIWFEGVDILINSADRWEKSPFPSEDIGPWERIIGTGVNGPYYVTNAFAPMMLERGGGAIVNIVDLSAWEAWPNFTAHAVAKSALLALTRQSALELGPTIRVNAVAPGPVLPPSDYSPKQIENVAARTLLNRWGSAEDVAQAVKFLIEADYISGETIRVDGGEHYGHRKHS
ncbi:MAG: SDR family oxidoreductase [Anaerolineae bacterium]|nr:SDR family oxidoreductase [Anaerolineales bacterium]MCQ3974534.1 short-chain dehydrogenase [Anaerolineae bacterium]